MTSAWLSIRVDLVRGHDEWYWPRPGRLFAAAPTHTFAQVAKAIDDACTCWDRSHLHQFTRADGSELGIPSHEDEIADCVLDYHREKLSALRSHDVTAAYPCRTNCLALKVIVLGNQSAVSR